MTLFMAITADDSYARSIQIVFIFASVGGFTVATIIGAIAWYNSKRPAGWEDNEKAIPKWIPRIKPPNKQTTSVDQKKDDLSS